MVTTHTKNFSTIVRFVIRGLGGSRNCVDSMASGRRGDLMRLRVPGGVRRPAHRDQGDPAGEHVRSGGSAGGDTRSHRWIGLAIVPVLAALSTGAAATGPTLLKALE